MGGTISCFEPGYSAALFQAAVDGDLDAVEQSVRKNPELLMAKGVGMQDSAWHLAAGYGRAEVLQTLYKLLVEHKDEIRLRFLLKKKIKLTADEAVEAVLNISNTKGQTPLMFACFAGKSDCVSFLVQVGADVWAQDRCGMRTALHYAAMRGSVTCIRAVLESVPEHERFRYTSGDNYTTTSLVDMRTVSGLTPLHFAAHAKTPGVAKILLDFGALATAGTYRDDAFDLVSCPISTTPLHLAAYVGNFDAAMEILKSYVERRETGQVRDPRHALDRRGHTPYHVASLRRQALLMEVLHPLCNLESLFPPEEVEQWGVPKLSLLAAQVLKNFLLGQVEAADARIAQLPPIISRHPTALPRASSNGGASPVSLSKAPSLVTAPPNLSAPSRGTRGSSTGASPTAPAPAASLHGSSGEQAAVGSWAPQVSPFALMGSPPTALGVRSPGPRGAGEHTRGGAEEGGELGTSSKPISRLSRLLSTKRDPRSKSTTLPDVMASPHGSMQPGQLDSSFTGNLPMPAATPASPSPWRGRLSKQNSAALPSAGDKGVRATNDQLPTASLPLHIKDQPQGAVNATDFAAALANAEQLFSPFLAVSWGTSAMLATMPVKAQCCVCLDDTYALVTKPCLHRVCAACSRRMVAQIKQAPLACPICRQTVKGLTAPTDLNKLAGALLQQQQQQLQNKALG